MIKVKCLLCEKKSEIELDRELTDEEELKQYTIQSPLISKNEQTEILDLSKELMRHMEMAHMSELQAMAGLQASFGGFLLINRFATQDDESIFEKGKEEMRDLLEKQIVLFSPEDDEEDEIENDLTVGEEEEDEEDEEEDEEFEDVDE